MSYIGNESISISLAKKHEFDYLIRLRSELVPCHDFRDVRTYINITTSRLFVFLLFSATASHPVPCPPKENPCQIKECCK